MPSLTSSRMFAAVQARWPWPISRNHWLGLQRLITVIYTQTMQAGLLLGVSGLLLISLVAVHVTPELSIYVNAASAVLLTVIALRYVTVRPLAITAAIIPVANMLPLSLAGTPALVRLTGLYATLLFLSLAYRQLLRLEKQPAAISFAYQGYWLALPLMIVIGQVLAGLGFGLLPHSQPFAGLSIPLTLAVAGVFALIEPIFFQGLLQPSAAQVASPKLALILTTVVYVGLFANASPLAILFSLVCGAGLALVYYFTQNVLLVMTTNAVLKLVFIGLLVVLGS